MVVVWLKDPEVPVMVTVLVPVVAVLLAFNVSVLVVVPGFGLNDAVTPLPMPVAANVTLPVKPPDGVMVILVVPLADRSTVKLVGEADKVKLPDTAAVTVSETVVVWVMLPPVPDTVMVYVPVVVVEATVMVMSEVPEPGAAMGFVPKPTVTPVGWPEAVNVMAESKPPETLVVIVEVPLLPRTTETEVGEAERAKLGDAAVPVSALIRPLPFGLPQPVAKS